MVCQSIRTRKHWRRTHLILSLQLQVVSRLWSVTDPWTWKISNTLFWMSVTKCLTPSVSFTALHRRSDSQTLTTIILDMRRDVQEIFRGTPHDKQVMMFSATLSKETREICKKFMQDVNINFHYQNSKTSFPSSCHVPPIFGLDKTLVGSLMVHVTS